MKWLRIIDVDLDAPCVHLEVDPDESDEFLARLEMIVALCGDEGVDDVRLMYRRGTSKRDLMRLKDLCAMKRLAPPAILAPRGKRAAEDTVRGGAFRSEFDRASDGSENDGPGVRYQLGVGDLGLAVERLNTAIALICASERLDPRSTLQLRLCVYELAMNSVEHGEFNNDNPTIHLTLEFSGNWVRVAYLDNAAGYLPDGRNDSNLVLEQIHSSNKRGLGLYMLNRICAEFGYDRSEKWNETTFSLEMNREHCTPTKR